MKITGPGTGVPPEIAADATKAGDSQKDSLKIGGKPFADKLEGGAQVGPTSQATATSQAQRSDNLGGVADIGDDLRAGRITPQAALERVIDRVVERQVGADAPASLREKVGEALRQALEDDPMLAEKVRALSS
jgi:hypothetical protein